MGWIFSEPNNFLNLVVQLSFKALERFFISWAHIDSTASSPGCVDSRY